VIECLKMATTGELPPSARAGQAFIHDPKVADVTEVKAQIKLRFRDVRRQPCVVTRSFQLAQKSGGKLEKKDLDQVIQTLDEKTGERVSVSRKCADINATVPDMMGVSKAILENVVFRAPGGLELAARARRRRSRRSSTRSSAPRSTPRRWSTSAS
jgi:DNA repair protein RAD50